MMSGILVFSLFTLLKIMLNESNSHCYLCYRNYGPTTDINIFNATVYLYLDILSIIH